MKKLLLILVLALVLARSLSAQEVRNEIAFPDVPGYVTLKCDFHMHTVFSDGDVWPPVRVEEAWRTGLDAIAITDHIEYQPHKDDVPTNHNRPFELARESAKERNIILIHAAEITRETPPGHYNALFLSDNAFIVADFPECVHRANEQGAFVFWNHHTWKGAEAGRWTDTQQKLYDAKRLHGLEVANGGTYYPDAHRWCIEKKMTMLGNSDIHDPDLRLKNTDADHRTVTLIFAKERAEAGIREALNERRTAVWVNDQLIGLEEVIAPLFRECVKIEMPHYRGKDAWASVRNNSEMTIRLTRTDGPGPGTMTLKPRSVGLIRFRPPENAKTAMLKYIADNFLVEPGKGLPVAFEVELP
ncbi:MAG TPA: histidinol-phosphatase [Candidatus Brocadiia bacterium]|nr:histidinol-phosphatase [Candidatus Brocadiia bacterium]